MKKLYSVMSLILMCAVLLTACQPTPETPPVVSKNDGTLENAISNGAEDEYVFTPPERCPEIQNKYYDDRLVISCGTDTKVTAPEGKKYAVYEATMSGFTPEIIDFINEACFDGATMYGHDAPLTKEELTVQELLPAKEELWELEQGKLPESYYYDEIDGGFTDDSGNIYTIDDFIAQQKEYINEIEQKIASAPEVSAPQVITSTGYNASARIGECNFDVDIPMPDGSVGRICATDNNCMKVAFGKYAVKRSWVDEFGTSNILLDSLYPDINDSLANLLEYREDTRVISMLTEEKVTSARETAAEFVHNTLNMDYMLDVGYGIENGHDPKGVYNSESDFTADSMIPFYAVMFQRTIDGIPLHTTNEIVREGRFYQIYAEAFIRYESLVVFLDENGVVSGFTWIAPMTVKNTAQESVKLQDFETIAKNGMQMLYNQTTFLTKEMLADMMAFLEANPNADSELMLKETDTGTISLNMQSCDLGYMLVRKKGADLTQWYFMPTWNAVYTQTIRGENDEYISTRQQLINAVDGSIIDIGQGY